MLTYLETSHNVMSSLTNIKDRLASISRGITHFQMDVYKIYSEVET